MTHHPSWSEIRDLFLSDPEVAAAAEELYHVLIEDDALYARLREDSARGSLREQSNASNGEAFGVAE